MTTVRTDQPTRVPSEPATTESDRPGWLRRAGLWSGQNGIIVATVVLFVVMSIASPRFLTQSNLFNILDQQAPLGIIACAITLVMIAGGFDLSVGAMYALTAVVSALVANAVGAQLGLLAAILAGCLLGAFNGAIVAFGRIMSFIATLATAIIMNGVILVITGGFVISVTADSFGVIGQDKFLGLRWAAWLFLAVIAVSWFVLARTTFGRRIYAVGGNPEAARLSGIRVQGIRFATFVISGAAAGMAGMIDVSRVGSAQSGVGAGIELTAIAAVVIGGTSLAGGQGAIWRSVLGVLFLAMLSNGFNLLGVDTTFQKILQGFLILLGIALSVWSGRRNAT